MFRIAKQFRFSASHQLEHLPQSHKCARLHGHNYTVEAILQAHDLDEDGFVVDYGELSSLKEYIDSYIDHRHLNDVFQGPAGTTAENLARSIYYMFCDDPTWGEFLVAVRVSETENSWATYWPGGGAG